MHRPQRTRLVTSTGVLTSALLCVVLAGCSATSPNTITTPYPASDGVMADLGTTGVGLRNFLVVGTAKGAPASVIGSVINHSDAEVQVSLQADLGESAQPSQTVVRVPAHGVTAIGPAQQTKMTIPDLPVIPGANTGLSAATLNGGRADLQVPVVTAANEYSSLAPAAAPTGNPSASAPSQNEQGGGGATGTPSVPAARDTTDTDETMVTSTPSEQ